MGEYAFLLGVAIALLIGVISPGPSFIYIARTSVAQSRNHGIAGALGMGVGAAAFALMAAFGLYIVLENVPWLYLAFKIIGGCYLCFLAYRIWCGAGQPLQGTDAAGAMGGGLIRAFYFGLLTQLSNPKTAVVFASIFAALLPASVPEFSYLLLGVLAFIIDAGWYSIVAFLLSSPASRKTYAGFKTFIDRLAAGILGALGLKLASDL